MKRIITYEELPQGNGQKVYLRLNNTDPSFYLELLKKRYRIVNRIKDTDEDTIYIRWLDQAYLHEDQKMHREQVNKTIAETLEQRGIRKPKTLPFTYEDLIEHKYQVPFVLKNINESCGREKFLIATEEDYENLIQACDFLLDSSLKYLINKNPDEAKVKINYDDYLHMNFFVQQYITTPTEYNTSMRVLTSSSNDLMYASLKYNPPRRCQDNTTLLGYLLEHVYPLSTNTIVSNTMSGGKNVILEENSYTQFERSLLENHNLTSERFENLVEASLNVHTTLKKDIGCLCSFDYIYSAEENKWYVLEYHMKSMFNEYAARWSIPYQTKEERIAASGRVRATSLALTMQKKIVH